MTMTIPRREAVEYTPAQRLEHTRQQAAGAIAGRIALEELDALITNYVNALQTARPARIFRAGSLSEVTRGVAQELDAFGDIKPELAGRRSCFYDLKGTLDTHLNDEQSYWLSSSGFAALPRAVTLTVLEEICRW